MGRLVESISGIQSSILGAFRGLRGQTLVSLWLIIGIFTWAILALASDFPDTARWYAYVENYINSTQRETIEPKFEIREFSILNQMHVDKAGGTYVHFGFKACREQEIRKYVGCLFLPDNIPAYTPQWENMMCYETGRERGI